MTLVLPVTLPTSRYRVIVTAELSDLTPAQTFAAFTTPELLVQWWPQAAEIQPRLDGCYRLLWPNMNRELFGQFTEFVSGERLSFTWNWTHRPDLFTRTVTIEFASLRAGSQMTVQHGTYGDSAVEQDDRQGHIDRWLYFLGRLQGLGQITS